MRSREHLVNSSLSLSRLTFSLIDRIAWVSAWLLSGAVRGGRGFRVGLVVKLLVFFGSTLILGENATLAQSSSPSFQMTIETLNTGGGASGSTSFALFGCLAPAPEAGGSSSSASFRLNAGCPVISAGGQVCGNGAVEAPEACDDSDTDDGDGCSSSCSVEPGWTCTDSPSVCTPLPTVTPTQSPTFTPTHTSTFTPTSTPSYSPSTTPTFTATATPTYTPTSTETATSTPSSTPTFTPICNGVPPGDPCDDGLFCNGVDTCDGAGTCGTHTGSPCDDGDACTADTCNEVDHCQYAVVGEARACGTCLDEVDNDEDGDTDADDAGCSTLSESQHFALIGRSTKAKSVVLGTNIQINSAPGSVPESSSPFPLGPSRGGVCGEAKMELLSAIQIAGSLAAAADRQIKFGSSGDTNIGAYFVDAPTTTRILTGMAPVVGPGTCSAEMTACTLDVQCNPPASTCEGMLLEVGNPYVDNTGTHEEFQRCSTAKAALIADTNYLYALPSQALDPISHHLGAPQPLPVLSGPGPHLLRVAQVRVSGTALLTVTADDPDAVVVIQVTRGLSIAKGANVQVGGQLKAENLLWVAQGKGSVKILGSSTFAGTVLGGERTARIGQNVHIDGGLLVDKLKINGSSSITHRPFTPLL